MLEAVLLKLHTQLAPEWALIQANFDPTQEIGPKLGGGHSFMSGCSFARYSTALCSYSKGTAMVCIFVDKKSSLYSRLNSYHEILFKSKVVFCVSN